MRRVPLDKVDCFEPPPVHYRGVDTHGLTPVALAKEVFFILRAFTHALTSMVLCHGLIDALQ
jgi:hypothetical protein